MTTNWNFVLNMPMDFDLWCQPPCFWKWEIISDHFLEPQIQIVFFTMGDFNSWTHGILGLLGVYDTLTLIH